MALPDHSQKVLKRENFPHGDCMDPDGWKASRAIFWNLESQTPPEGEGLPPPQAQPDIINWDINQHGQEEQQGIDSVHGPETILDYHSQNQMAGGYCYTDYFIWN
jgi:hypothetical protein